MLEIIQRNTFLKNVKALKKKHYPLEQLYKVVDILSKGDILPGKYHDHFLVGEWKGCRECHIAPNWLLIYVITETEVILVATGSHDDLFK